MHCYMLQTLDIYRKCGSYSELVATGRLGTDMEKLARGNQMATVGKYFKVEHKGRSTATCNVCKMGMKKNLAMAQSVRS